MVRAAVLAPFVSAALVLPLCAQDSPQPPDPSRDPALLAVIWVQHSAEYRALCRQTFNAARPLLEIARNDRDWTAALEQSAQKQSSQKQSAQSDYRDLPWAIVVDVDETVLDNSPYAARRISSGTSHSSAAWSQWVDEAQASPLPGAVEFLASAAQMGVTIFYVTNRSHDAEDRTRANLARLGFPLADTETVDVVLTFEEQPDWGSDKGTRRAHVAKSFRILMLFGDDLGDFMSGVRPSLDPAKHDAASLRRHSESLEAERALRTDDFAAWFGTRWFMLPNPTYGSWLDVAKLAATERIEDRGGRPTPIPDFARVLRTRSR
ncbi:MAG: hypothetical protein HZB39_20225 [Planctomycetes bacterium]|nr:hypothetical protein [Planctomycetota bacterium]